MNTPTDCYIIKGILTNYGYCVKKSLYSNNAIECIRVFFNVKPKLMYEDEDPNKQEDTSFDVYFEDDVYIVLPKFYSNSFLKVDFLDEKTKKNHNKITFTISKTQYKPTTTNFKFTGNLRDYQMTIIQSILKNFGLEYKNGELIEIDKTLRPKGGIIQLSTGAGKCLAKDTGIIMYDGSIKKVQDIVVGDLLMGDDSGPRTVLSLGRGREIMYRISSENGSSYIVNKSHILSLKYNNPNDKENSKDKVIDISVENYLKFLKTHHSENNSLCGYRVPIIFQQKELSIDPYIYGYWLGNNSSTYNQMSNQISIKEKNVFQYFTDCFKNKHTNLYLQHINSEYYKINSLDTNNVFDNFLVENYLLEQKYIVHDYKCNSRENQLTLLAGIIDSCGYHMPNNTYEIIHTNEKLLTDIIYLTRSLGFGCLKQQIKNTDGHESNIANTDTFYKISIYGRGLEEINVMCPEKKTSVNYLAPDCLKYRIKLEELAEDEYYGFEIDGNRRFVLDDFTVTHNTVLAIFLAHILKLKTLIIVHQEFLQDQWIERFKMFTDATIGTIRGTIIDILNKDVVIGMLQSISIKEYEDDVFKDFGLVIYDEVHHFGSRVFSQALLKTSAKYNIGLSATPERMDGLIKVVKWFTGDILYKMEKKYDYKVLVKKIYFRSNDPLYKEKKNWIKGQMRPNHIKMTENIMKNKMRNKLMINAIDCLRSMGRTIFVISSRVEHLQILKNGVDSLIAQAKEQHIYNTYYYIGPTKKGEKKMAEKDGNIIFATIQLASEALDIPRLDTIVLALPIKQDKTLIQSVGRILRNDKLESLTQIPVVVDISDILSIYQKWSEKRNLVYARKNWFLQNYYWEDDEYLYRGEEDKNLKPMNIIFDNIEDEDFIEKNLILKPEDLAKEKELILEDDDTSSNKEKNKNKNNTSSLKTPEPKIVYTFKGKKYD
jgi:superfamily II DNA or RNA helicase